MNCLTISEAAVKLNVSYYTIKHWVNSGTLPVFKLSGSSIIRIHPDSLKKRQEILSLLGANRGMSSVIRSIFAYEYQEFNRRRKNNHEYTTTR